jgi:hypothetical protein
MKLLIQNLKLLSNVFYILITLVKASSKFCFLGIVVEFEYHKMDRDALGFTEI